MKQIRDWTLGEIKAECVKYEFNCCADCPLDSFCNSEKDKVPDSWDLTDPPRFDADELALMRMLYKGGARWLARDAGGEIGWCDGGSPRKRKEYWSPEESNNCGEIPCENDLLKSIQWSDAEPVEIAKYIELKGGDDE